MLISPRRALGIVLKNVRPLKSTRMPLDEALGHCLAEDVRADRDMPPAHRSAMDGFAVRASDVKACPVELRLVGEVAAGSSARPRVRQGTCARVLTGANIPPGADAIVKVEETEEESDVPRLVEEVLPLTGLNREGGRICAVMPAHDPTTSVISR